MINKDWWLTVQELEAHLGIPKTTVSEIFDPGFWHETLYGKIHSTASAMRAEEHPAAVANDLIQTTTNEPDFLKKVITRDDWWIHS